MHPNQSPVVALLERCVAPNHIRRSRRATTLISVKVTDAVYTHISLSLPQRKAGVHPRKSTVVGLLERCVGPNHITLKETHDSVKMKSTNAVDTRRSLTPSPPRRFSSR